MKTINSKKLVKLIKEKTWLLQGFNGLPLYLHNVASNTGWMLKKVGGVNYTHFLLRMHGNRAKYYYDEKDLSKIGYGYYKKNKNIGQIKILQSNHKKDYLKARSLAGPVDPGQLNKLSLKDLIFLAQRISKELTMSIGITHAIEGISFVSEMKLGDMLDKRNLNNQENFQLLASPLTPSFLSEAQAELWRIKNNKNNKNLARDFLNKFGWIENSYVEAKVLSVPDVYKKALHQKHPPLKTTLNKIKSSKAKLVKILGLTKQEVFVIKTIENSTKWQDDRKKFLMQTIGRFEPVVREIAKRLKFSTEKFKYICPNELNYKNLTNQNFLKALSQRYPQCVYYVLKNNVVVFQPKETSYIESKLNRISKNMATEIKGMVASKGKVKGRVRICRSIYDIPKVLKGEILVTSMTRPEFLPAMQKAAAFVTDEGGITSHAAIVSREMGKPCIIGTKNGTEVLKNGDMVEVDANNGIVKIIPK